MKPFRIARISIVSPIVQLSSRGLRNAPVKNTRAMCSTIEPTKMSQAQWCICRIRRPARTENERFTVEANACDMIWPSSGAYGPW